MYYPAFYTERIKHLITTNKYLYHWTKFDCALNIIQDKFFYSKARLFGLQKGSWPQKISSHPDLLSDTQNGFIDYIFLGNTNWIEMKNKSYYGEVGFQIQGLNLLQNNEFYVFPFNTGRYYQQALEKDKVSDLTTLLNTFDQKTKSYEVLVRGKIELSLINVSKIICERTNFHAIETELAKANLNNIKIEVYDK